MGRLRSRLLGDPIVHFTVLGAVLFGVHALVAQPEPAAGPAADGERRIVIAADRVAGLVESWRQAWGRPPSPAELDEMVEEEVRTEILAREATAQGLARNDEYIRQHLRERLEVMIDAGAGTSEPTEAELEAFYAANRSRFGAGPVVSFDQVALDPQRRGGNVAADAAALLARLRGPEAPTALETLGDPLDLPTTFDQVPEPDLASMFGEDFAARLLQSPVGQWHGPVSSSYGEHLVRLNVRAEATGLPFDEVRENVREEWLAARIAARRDRIYRDLRQTFDVVVERPAEAPFAAAAVSGHME